MQLLALLFALVFAYTPRAHADDLSWTGIAGSGWDDTTGGLVSFSNWFPFGVAGAGDDIFLTDGASSTNINLNGNRTVNSVNFDGTISYGLNRNTLTIQSGVLNAAGAAILTINSDVNLGANALWDIDGTTFVNLNGSLGGVASTTTLTKNGTGNLWLTGNNTHGGTIVNAGQLTILDDAGLGAAGAGLTLGNASKLKVISTNDVHFDAARTLTIDGGQAEMSFDTSGVQYTWAGVIDGAGGINKTGQGTLVINSAASNTNTGLTTLSEGILSLQTQAGVAAVGGDLSTLGLLLEFNADHQTPGDTDLTVLSGVVAFNGTSQRFNQFTIGSGEFLRLNNGSELYANTIDPTSGTFADAFGTLGSISTSRVTGSMTLNTATFSPGDGIGSATIEGALELRRGTLAFVLGGTTPGLEHDQLIVQGSFNNSFSNNQSILDIQLDSGFNPSAGDTFDILDFASVTGTFATINLPTLDAGLLWDDSALYTTGTLAVRLALLLGDADGDGDVDAFDITAVEQNFGNTGEPGGSLLGDADGDGDVDAFDITAVEQNFGNTFAAPSVLDGSSIPEPTSLALLGLGGVMLFRRGAR